MSAPSRFAPSAIVPRHLRAGWWGLALFATIGIGLEMLHAIKSPLYLDAGRETTRLMLRLGHAHGTLLSLVNVAWALTVRAKPKAARPATSVAFLLALVLLPSGFLLGALGARGGDPGLGIVLVPAGALSLVVACALAARGISLEE